jgi:hypothetical protein
LSEDKPAGLLASGPVLLDHAGAAFIERRPSLMILFVILFRYLAFVTMIIIGKVHDKNSFYLHRLIFTGHSEDKIED